MAATSRTPNRGSSPSGLRRTRRGGAIWRAGDPERPVEQQRALVLQHSLPHQPTGPWQTSHGAIWTMLMLDHCVKNLIASGGPGRSADIEVHRRAQIGQCGLRPPGGDAGETSGIHVGGGKLAHSPSRDHSDPSGDVRRARLSDMRKNRLVEAFLRGSGVHSVTSLHVPSGSKAMVVAVSPSVSGPRSVS